LKLYEREVSIEHNDVFHRLCKLNEKPLEMCLLWKLNGDRKSFAVTDHDPSMKKYLNPKLSIEDLSKRVEKLDKEEKEMEEEIRKNYAKAKEIVDQCIKKKISSLSRSRSALETNSELKFNTMHSWENHIFLS
jgi:hypothetical protein